MDAFVTGANGYIGAAVARVLAEAGMAVRAGVRRAVALPSWVEPVVTGDLAEAAPDFAGVSVVVHAAGLGHRRGVPEAVWRRANVAAPVTVARAARAAGVARFVLVSTAHVHGRVHAGVVRDGSALRPMDEYAASKVEAERAVAAEFGAGLTIVRPVAVIGPRCPGNLQLVMAFLQARRLLPFGSIANRRSFIDVGDLARLVLAVVGAEAALDVVLAAHPEAIATPALIRALARGMEVEARLLPFPPAILAAAARLSGRGAMWQSLAGSFVAAPEAALALGWKPRKTLEESLVRTGANYAVS
jgi:UDP-glucose 4-epimerase